MIRMTAQKTVIQRDRRNWSAAEYSFLANGRRKSMIVVDASEFKELLSVDMAAARIAATISPRTPWGSQEMMKAGKILSLSAAGTSAG